MARCGLGVSIVDHDEEDVDGTGSQEHDWPIWSLDISQHVLYAIPSPRRANLEPWPGCAGHAGHHPIYALSGLATLRRVGHWPTIVGTRCCILGNSGTQSGIQPHS